MIVLAGNGQQELVNQVFFASGLTALLSLPQEPFSVVFFVCAFFFAQILVCFEKRTAQTDVFVKLSDVFILSPK